VLPTRSTTTIYTWRRFDPMFRGRHGGTLLLVVIATVTALAMLAMADDAEAAWSGEPLPSWGSDWWINQDTVYTEETIRLNGNIYVTAPYTLSLDGCTLIFNCSWAGEHGINVWWGSVLYINDTANGQAKVQSNASSERWRFSIDGEAYLTGADMKDINEGIWNWNTFLSVEGCTIESYRYGIMSFTDAHIGNSTINVVYDHFPWGPAYVETVGVYASNGDYGLYNLDIDIRIDINETYNSSTTWGDYYLYGIYMYSANVGKLVPQLNKEFSINIDMDLEIHNYYDTTGYVTFYNYFSTRAIYMVGDTVCRAISDIDITVSEDVSFQAHNATMGARVYAYRYQEYIYSSIGSSGEAPSEISDILLANLGGNIKVMGEVYALNEYWYNSAIEIRDSDGAQPGDAITEYHDITIRDSKLETIFFTPRYGEWWIYDCVFDDLETERVLDMSYTDMDFIISTNKFTDITAMGDGDILFRLYMTVGEGLINNNTFENIEGWRLLDLYYTEDRVYFQNNLVTNNRQWGHITHPNVWMYVEESQDRVYIRWNTFEDSSYPGGMMYGRYTRDKFVLEANTFENNQFYEYMVYTERNQADVDIVENLFTRNNGPIIEVAWIYGRWAVSDNVFEYNWVGADYLIYTHRSYREMKITDNEFTGNTADGIIIMFKGSTYWSSIDFSFDRNKLTNNTASKAINGGVVVFRGMRYDVAARRNTFNGNTGNCINFYRPYSSNQWDNRDHTVDGNVFNNNDGTATMWIDYRSYNIIVKRNTGTNNTGPLFYHTITSRYVYDSFVPSANGEITGARSIEISSNNYSYNRAGAVEINPAQWRDANIPYNNAGQSILLSNNILLYNEEGWSIRVVDFGQRPLLVNNDFYGSRYGMFLQAINEPGRWPRWEETFTNMEYDGGGPMGMTAFGLVNIDFDFVDCTFTNFKEALYARDCTINVYWSAIPEGSGRTEGRGYIYVYNNLEILITWSDAMGVDSGVPAMGATLALLGTNGRYYGALTADAAGRIGPMLVMPWSSIEGKMDQWSPYDGTIASGGLTAHYVVNVVGEQVGEDSLHLLIQDTVVPEVIVTSPSMNSLSNMVDLPVEGFLFETGAGVTSFMGYLDGGEGVEVDPEQTWTIMFNGLDQGEHTIVFEAIDGAMNSANTSVTFLIDALSPLLDIVSPEDDHVTRDPNLLVQGSYQDDVSDLSVIEVRINGVAIGSTTGVINEYVTLTEGVNTILIDATDAAGNTEVVRRIVTLDSYPPTLYVYVPLDDLVTANPVLNLDGLSEAGTPILVEQVRASNGDLISTNDLVAKADGTFRTSLDLIEGAQHIVFTAEDPAGNVRSITRTVTLDTTPPGLTILRPDEGEHVNTPTVALSGQVSDENPQDVTVFVNGIRVDHQGVINEVVPLVEGLNTIVVIAVDPVENEAIRTVNVTRDTIPPELMVDNPEFVLTNERELTVRGSVNDDAALVTINGVAVNVDEDNKFSEVMDLANDDNPIVVIATDLAGNSVMYMIAFVFDNEAPTIELVDPPKAVTSDLVIMLNGTVTDSVAAIQTVTVRGQVYPVIDGKFNVLVAVDTAGSGWNNFTINAVDDAGNDAVHKINIQYEPGKPPVDPTVKKDENLWWYYGILLIIAACVMMGTVFIFAKRGEEE
jgi:hypothetical protein